MLIVQYTIDAVSQGALYAVLALSLGLLFSVMRLVNFAYGELIMIAGFTMYGVRGVLPWPLVVVAAILVPTIASVAMERIAFRPVRMASVTTLLVTSLAVSFGLQSLARIIFGSLPKGVEPYAFLSSTVTLGEVRIAVMDLVTIAACGAMMLALGVLLNRTDTGIRLRAATEDFTMTQMLGVNADRVIASAFAITGALAGVVGFIIVSRTGTVDAAMGTFPILVAFVGIVIGGMGTLLGPAIGGFLLGALQSVLQVVLPSGLDPYVSAFAFVLVITVLVLRPAGLLGAPDQVRV